MNISNKSTRNRINYKHDKRNDTYVSPSVSQSMFHEQNVFGKYERNREEKHVECKVEVRSDYHKKGLKGISHDDVLSEIAKVIDIEDVLSIQITEKDCIVTLKNPESKDRLAAQGIALRDRSVKFYEVESLITHVTIKDAPYELDNLYIVAQMLRFGKVVPGSLKRGVIKGTNIENGSRYIDILECDTVLPNRTSFGRFEVRLFADNNRTPCIYCHITGHPSYRCKDKPSLMNQKRCYNCCGIGHVANACTSEAYCSYCNANGHARRDCEQYKQETEKKELGSYGPEILEGRQDNTKNIHTDEDDKESIASDNTNCERETVSVLLGASNCIRLGHIDDSVVNASISGGSFDKIEQNIDLAFQKTENKDIEKVVICLGTNDISRNKSDSDQINLLVTSAVNRVKSSFPEAQIGLCNIIPRKGNGAQFQKINETTKNVNSFMKKLCVREQFVAFVDINDQFYKHGAVIRTLFDKNDSSGVHVSTEGAQRINSKLCEFLNSPNTNVVVSNTPIDRKRNRSDKTTPTSADRTSKVSRKETGIDHD
ncbi:CNBP [Mytilus edulis]|uniref:CNBP n=1 Tax=Mytilus edulis TaxID=6550 RepID=A0A8S3S5V1_MYTED|nr:CNBP [Mytilus edulis]